MRKCPFCGHDLSDEEYAELVRAKGAAGGRAKTERKKAAGAKNLEKARAALSPERRAEILRKARETKTIKKGASHEKRK